MGFKKEKPFPETREEKAKSLDIKRLCLKPTTPKRAGGDAVKFTRVKNVFTQGTGAARGDRAGSDACWKESHKKKTHHIIKNGECVSRETAKHPKKQLKEQEKGGETPMCLLGVQTPKKMLHKSWKGI